MPTSGKRTFDADSLLVVEDNEGNRPEDGNQYAGKKSAKSHYYATATTLLVLLPAIGLAVWLSRVGAQANLGLESEPLGGRLTQVQAKSIDFVCGALISPLILVGLNWYWFSVTRVTVLSDGSKSMPLAALVEASYTDSGSYSPFKLTSLVRSGRPQMLLLGALVLLSAVVQTCFSNVIAYEAYTVSEDISSLVPLKALMTGINDTALALGWSRVESKYNFTSGQKADFISQATATMSSIAFAGSVGKLDNDTDTYVALNVTESSLRRLAPNIIRLENLPAFRLWIQCEAATSRQDAISITQIQHNVVMASTFFDNSSLFQATFPGQVDAVADEWVTFESWLGFNLQYNESYLFHLIRSNLTNDTDPSPYGEITYTAQNMSRWGYEGTKGIMSTWGFHCNLSRETGSAKLSRASDLTWLQDEISWTGKREYIKWSIADWQVALNYRSPVFSGGQPGLGPAIAETAIARSSDFGGYDTSSCDLDVCLDYSKSMRNLLYAAGEMERLAYEVLNADAELTTETTYTVAATTTDEFYRMTYVPLILLIGLLSALLAALIPFGLLVYHRRTNSVRTWREVHTVQLMADSVAGLRDEHVFHDMRGAGNRVSERLARKATVQYEVLGSQDVSLRLVK